MFISSVRDRDVEILIILNIVVVCYEVEIGLVGNWVIFVRVFMVYESYCLSFVLVVLFYRF